MNSTNIQTQWGKVLLVLAAIGAVMGVMIMVGSPANAHDRHHGDDESSSSTTSGPCVPFAGQEYIAPTVVHHDAVTHVEWKYSQHGGSGQLWVDNDTYKYIKSNGVGTNSRPEHGTYYERTEHTRTVTDSAAYDEVTNPGQPYIAPVVCETTSTSTTTSSSSTTTTSTTTTTTTTSPPVDLCPNIEGVQETLGDYLVNNDGNCYIPETSTTTTTTTTTSPPVDVCPNIDGVQATVPDGYFLADGDCVQDSTLGVSSSDTPTPTLTEVTLAATGAGGTTGGVALALSLVLGGLGVMLLRRQVGTEI
jgi:hypothetical protein